MNIKTKIANRKNYGNKRSLTDIKYIVIHYTANDGDTDENNASYFSNNVTGTSAHYFVDDDSITQSVPDNFIAYHCGSNKGYKHFECRNSNSIAIELCDDIKNGVVYPSTQTIENTVQLTKLLMEKYKIPKQNVLRHYDVTGKACPLYWVNNSAWNIEFLNKLNPLLTSSNDITWELNHTYFPISDTKKFVSDLEEAKKKNSSLYWGYYKLVNKIK